MAGGPPFTRTGTWRCFASRAQLATAHWSGSLKPRGQPPRWRSRTSAAQPAALPRLRTPSRSPNSWRNFLYADGDTLFAHGHRRIQASGQILPPGLFLLSRQCAHADEAVQALGVSVAPGFQQVLLIASVPLTDEKWRPFSEGELVAVSAGRLVGTNWA